MIVNTPSGGSARADGYEIRAAAVAADKALFTTMAVLGAAVSALPVLAPGLRRPEPAGVRRRSGGTRMSGGSGSACATRIAERGRLCVGIDPHEHLLTQWGLDASAAGVREFGLRVVDAAAGRVGIVKPQVAFFERYGSAGLRGARGRAGRGPRSRPARDRRREARRHRLDHGRATRAAWLTPGSPLEADALTVNPYLGVGSLGDTVALALAHGKGLFVLAATSNPEAAELQTGARWARRPWPDASSPTSSERQRRDHRSRGSGGASASSSVRPSTGRRSGSRTPSRPPAPILAPGFGHQGATLSDLAALFGALAPAVIASESRGILAGGAAEVADRIQARLDQLEEAAHG